MFFSKSKVKNCIGWCCPVSLVATGATTLVLASFQAGFFWLPFPVYSAILIGSSILCVGTGTVLFSLKAAASFVNDEIDTIVAQLKEVKVEHIRDYESGVLLEDDTATQDSCDNCSGHRITFTV
jgi:hypothetical protein